jgi:dCTP deaminase
MSVMTDSALKTALKDGSLHIDPAPAEIKAASIDFRLGPEAFLGTGEEIIDVAAKRLLIIPPGEMAIVSVMEKVIIGPRLAGHIGLRSSYSRKGLALLAGPQIDPGFRGRLHVVLVNLSPTEIAIGHGEPLLTIVFHDLGVAVERPYGEGLGDDYQEQDHITPKEMDDIRQHRGYAMSQVISEMQSIALSVGALQTSVGGYIRRTDLYLKIFVGTIVSLALAVVGAVVGLALKAIGS